MKSGSGKRALLNFHQSGYRKAPAIKALMTFKKKQGATGITTVAPYIAGQWGRGNNRLLERLTSPEVVPAAFKYFQKFSYTVK